MSRSSEIRSQRYKAARQRQQQLLQGSNTEANEDEQQQDFDDLPSANFPMLVDELVVLNPKLDENYNLHPFVIDALYNNTPYFKRCQRISRFPDLLQEMETKVNHVEPFSHQEQERVCSNAYCLLYRAMEMKLTKQQLELLLSPQSPALVRALGALYMRYVGRPEDLWYWLEPLFLDLKTQFAPHDESTMQVSLASWAKSMLDVRYCGTMLPRLPMEVEQELRANIARAITLPEFAPGVECEAVYEEDGKWYTCRIDEEAEDGAAFWVTFLPEEEFGNQELVKRDKLRIITQ